MWQVRLVRTTLIACFQGFTSQWQSCIPHFSGSVCIKLRWEFIKENGKVKKERKNAFDQVSDQEKKKEKTKTQSIPRKLDSRKNVNDQEKEGRKLKTESD